MAPRLPKLIGNFNRFHLHRVEKLVKNHRYQLRSETGLWRAFWVVRWTAFSTFGLLTKGTRVENDGTRLLGELREVADTKGGKPGAYRIRIKVPPRPDPAKNQTIGGQSAG